jgi:protein-S-isoprenylcysteine O-methyltransferase Ste14
VPLTLIREDDALVHFGGLAPVTLGSGLLLWCVREFYSAGRGTLAPWSPPAALVTSGPYRFSRNPMYLAVVLILIGWAWGFGSRGLALYAVVVLAAFHARVLFYEEPWQARTFGQDWNRYKEKVPRWLWIW